MTTEGEPEEGEEADAQEGGALYYYRAQVIYNTIIPLSTQHM
jgi:hypothetical protein